MIKEKVFLNRVNVDYITLYAKAKDYFKRHGVDIQFDFVQSDYKNLSYKKVDFGHGQRILLQPYMANVVPIDNSYDITSFVFNGREFPSPNIPNGYCYTPIKQPFLDILTDELNPQGLDYNTICHEHMHALVVLANEKGFNIPDVMDTYYLNDQLENPLSNFGQQWTLLQPFVKTLFTNTYKWFSPVEVAKWGLKPELWQVLDKARDIAGTPFIITSGLRSPSQNALVGGKPNSSHLRGLAADLSCVDNHKRTQMIRGILTCGTPVFLEVAKEHLHVDIDLLIHPLDNTIIEPDDN